MDAAHPDFHDERWPRWRSKYENQYTRFSLERPGHSSKMITLRAMTVMKRLGETRFTLIKSIVKFEETAGGTMVSASLEVRFKGHWGWILKTSGKMAAEASAMDELEAFAKYAESIP